MLRKSTLPYLSVLLASFMLVNCAATTHADSGDTLIVRGDRLFIPITINGHETDALLDSGAEITFVDTGYAASIGLETFGAETAKGSGGETQISFAENVPVAALGAPLGDLTIAVLDLTDISERLVGSTLTAVLGRELFDGDRIEIDIENQAIRRASREMTPKGLSFTLETHRGIEVFDVRVNGEPAVKAEFDLGNGSEVLIGAAYAEKIGLLGEGNVVERRSGGGIGGAVDREIVLLKELEVAGRKFTDVEAAIDRTENAGDMNIGVAILKNFLITTDFAEKKLWLSPV